MSNPFPSKEYIDLCIKHQVILTKEWEKLGPRKGDFYIARRRSGDELKVVISNRRAKNFNAWSRTHEKVFIPRPDQLWEMLEKATGREEGQIGLEGPYPTAKTRYGVNISSEAGYIYHEGPTPSIALGKCLLEVLTKERVGEVEKIWGDEMIDAEIKRQFPNG